jgi:hypothetical protein
MVSSRLIRCVIIASAFLLVAVGLSSAQTNISVVVPAGSSLLCNPLNGTNGNRADQILRLSPLNNTYAQPPGTLNSFYILTWNGFSYNSVYYENDFTAANTHGAVTDGWATDASGTAQATPPTLNPGIGFFISNAGNPVTNAFFGTVIPEPGQTNNLHIGGGKSLIASRLPVSGLLTNSAFQFPIATFSDIGPPSGLCSFCILTWNGAAFDSSCYDCSSFPSGGWQGPVPNIAIGQSFFINNPGPVANWSQTQP